MSYIEGTKRMTDISFAFGPHSEVVDIMLSCRGHLVSHNTKIGSIFFFYDLAADHPVLVPSFLLYRHDPLNHMFVLSDSPWRHSQKNQQFSFIIFLLAEDLVEECLCLMHQL